MTDLLGDVTFRIDYNSDARISDGSILSAEEVGALAESDSDWSYHDAVYFDIELSDPEGNVSQPRSQIRMTVSFTRPVYAEKVNLVQFRYDDDLDREVPELMNPVDCSYTEDGGIYSFVLLADDLSTIGVICGEVLTESMAESAAELVMAESGTESAAEPVLTDSSAEQIPDIATAYPAQDFEDSTGEVSVTVHAPEGAFPAGTSMSLKTVENDVIEDISEAVSDEKTTVKKVHAVDITFISADGNEIEPLAPVEMTITSERTRRAEEAVVVHVSDEGDVVQLEQAVITEKGGEAEASLTVEGSETGDGVSVDSEAESVLTEAEDDGTTDSYTVEAESFSVYAIVYTVDFHWEVNGKVYDFSLPGGGFISLEHLVEVLGIGVNDTISENAPEDTTFSDINAAESIEEVETADDAQMPEDGAAYDEAIKLNEAEVSEATKNFVADVEKVEFSNPELVWVGKVNEETAVGGLKENNGLEVEYSADLTDDQHAAFYQYRGINSDNEKRGGFRYQGHRRADPYPVSE